MDRTVIDSSAFVAALFCEPGAYRLASPSGELLISAASYSEVLSQACSRGAPLDETISVLNRLSITVVPLDTAQAIGAARFSVSNGDAPFSSETWFAVSLAALSGCPLLTADSALCQLRLGVTIECVR